MKPGPKRKISAGLPDGMFARTRKGKPYYYAVDNGSQIGLGTDPIYAQAKLSRILALKMSKPQPPHRLLNWSEILDTSLAVDNYCGVYFLIKALEIVYVGQSKNVIRRIGQHPEKDFDRFSWILCKAEDLNRLEAAYIAEFKPKLNLMLAA